MSNRYPQHAVASVFNNAIPELTEPHCRIPALRFPEFIRLAAGIAPNVQNAVKAEDVQIFPSKSADNIPAIFPSQPISR